MVMLHTWSKV